MIVLDTNVISELMKASPDPAVVAWLDDQPAESVWTTAVCVFEILYGLAVLPSGKRKRSLQKAFDQMIRQDLEGRVLEFDTAAAKEAAAVAAVLKANGHSVEIRDVEIAGIVAARKGTLATRNTKHFAETGIGFVNPWESKDR